jgi:hypothetical protein
LNNHSPMPFANAEPPLAPIDPVAAMVAGLPDLVERASSLIESAARQLGLDAQAARLASQTATLMAGDRTVAILPMGQDDDALSLVLSVQTTLPVNTGGKAGDAVAVLQHAPGALHAFGASLGSTPEGCWTVYRSVRVGSDNGAALAAQLVETVLLADFVLPGASHAEH